MPVDLSDALTQHGLGNLEQAARDYQAALAEDPDRHDALYLLGLAAVFPLTGMGLAAYFACLAIGYVTGPFLLAVARVVLVVGIGWTALQWGGGLIGISLASAAAFALFGAGVFLLARRRFNALARG